MIVLAAVWLSGIFIGRCLPQAFGILFFSYFLLVLIFLLVLRKFPAMITPYVRKNRYPAMTLFLACLPLLFGGGCLRQQLWENGVEQACSVWEQLESDGETQVFVIGTVKSKTVDNALDGPEDDAEADVREKPRVTLILTDCQVQGYESGTAWNPAGDCQVIMEEGSEWLPACAIGNRVRVYGTFYLFESAGNPGQFDAKEYYHGKGLFASVRAKKAEILSEEVRALGQALFLLRLKLHETLEILYPPEKAGLLAAMLLGDKELLVEDIKELYQQNGISHILAISGLHISLLCMGFFRFLRHFLPIRAATFLAVVFLAFYVLFTGAGTSSLRAGIMCIVLLAGKLLHRDYDLLSSLSFAAILVSLLRPQDVVSAGFLLSFGAVIGIALAQEILSAVQEVGRFGEALVFGTVLQLMTIPISLWFFYELAPYSILLNLIIIPLASFVLVGGLLSVVTGLFIPGAAQFFSGGVYLILSFYEWLGNLMQKLPYSYVLLGRPAVRRVVVYYLVFGVAIWLLTRKTEGGGRSRENPEDKIMAVVSEISKDVIGQKRLLLGKSCVFFGGVTVCLLLLLLPEKKSFSLSFLDVSQGDGIVLQTETGRVLLFDGGSTDVKGVGGYRISPFLKQQGLALIDTVSVSHMDSDHYSGVMELLTDMPVYEGRAEYLRTYDGNIGICEVVLPQISEPSEEYLELVALCTEKQVAVRYVSAGDKLWREENLLLECLSPVAAQTSENDTSLVFLLQTPEVVVWLMGDAGVSAEETMLKRLGGAEGFVRQRLADRFCILKAGHHGSKTSTGEAFVSFLEPDMSVISCGYKNSYGHPHAEVVRRLAAHGSEVYRTDVSGCIRVKTGREGNVVVETWKE